ncbi:helix-turn-helix domain-containing protein [Sorangium sp. So ce406]|uniref:helix-turn-helix domain-containing protein n=1 Tax=Sorangium sp. So ce406 TaxID=3133311 RepID=UPI003F5C072F
MRLAPETGSPPRRRGGQAGCPRARPRRRRGASSDAEDLPEELLTALPPPRAPVALRSLAEVEREHILRVLDACGGSRAEAARVLGVGRNTLWRKLREYSTI